MTLEKYPERWEKHARDVRAHTGGTQLKYEPKIIPEFMKIFSEWSEKIEAELNNSTEAERK
jgi:hypothetical protein